MVINVVINQNSEYCSFHLRDESTLCNSDKTNSGELCQLQKAKGKSRCFHHLKFHQDVQQSNEPQINDNEDIGDKEVLKDDSATQSKSNNSDSDIVMGDQEEINTEVLKDDSKTEQIQSNIDFGNKLYLDTSEIKLEREDQLVKDIDGADSSENITNGLNKNRDGAGLSNVKISINNCNQELKGNDISYVICEVSKVKESIKSGGSELNTDHDSGTSNFNTDNTEKEIKSNDLAVNEKSKLDEQISTISAVSINE